jgi:hypothetical protein
MPAITLGGHVYALEANRNYFIDPSTLEVYKWHLNHRPDGDKGTEKKRNIEATANSGNVGLIRQQSDDEPLSLKREGDILHSDQEIAMWQWFQRCKSRTIYFVEFNGDAYEVQITDLKVERLGVVAVTAAGGKRYYAKYDLEMTVYAMLAGVLAEAGITP